MAIRQLRAQQYNSSIYSWVEFVDDLDLSPAYQRASVWDLERRRNLIKSLLMGLPIGVIFLNRRHVSEPQRVVDGKQRLETILMFARDEFSIPNHWVERERILPEHRGAEWIYWSACDVVFHRFFKNNTVATYHTTLPTEAAERELYYLINYGGVAHEPKETT